VVQRHRRALHPGNCAANLLWAIAAGAFLSLVIELTQAWLPGRSSSATDLFCNSLGTVIGALLALRWPRSGARSTA
jgi:glycopeptide antibiotics resistance protein